MAVKWEGIPDSRTSSLGAKKGGLADSGLDFVSF